MKTVQIKVYALDELSTNGKNKALETFRYIKGCDDWKDYIYEQFKERADKFFDVEKCMYTGFYSQGDGAMFEYSCITKETIRRSVKSLDLPEWKKQAIIEGAYIIGNGSHSGHYYHEKSCTHNIEISANNMCHTNIDRLIGDYHNEIETEIEKIYIDLCQELYSSLQEHYEFLISDEQVAEFIEAGDYEFYESGELFRHTEEG